MLRGRADGRYERAGSAAGQAPIRDRWCAMVISARMAEPVTRHVAA